MARRTRREMIREQAQRSFIGRLDVLQGFHANVSSEEPARMLFAISGEGGVGKTSLLDRLEGTCDDLDVPALAVRCDDRHMFPIDVIERIADRLGAHLPKDAGVRKLQEQLSRYGRLRRDIEADDDAPGLARRLVRPVTSGGVRMAQCLPGIGAAAGLVDPDDAGAAADVLASYLRRRVRSNDDIRLVREPDRVLTPLLLDAINTVAATGRRLVLFCDVFERTAGHLESWLWQTLHSEYGEIDPFFIVVVAGRDELGQAFGEFGEAVAFVQLQPFTDSETERYLTQRGIADPEVLDVILRDTGGLPALVELVASRHPQPGQPIPDVSGDAVERFLSWIDVPEHRSACLHAAIPRWFDAERLALALGTQNADDEFEWLQQEAFVRRPSSSMPGFHFHEKVRELMLRHLRNQRPDAVAEAHERLADHLRHRIDVLGLQPPKSYRDKTFQRHNIEHAYHRVSSQPDRALPTAAEEYLAAFRWHRNHAYAIAQSMEQALTEHDPRLKTSSVAALAEAIQADNLTSAPSALDQVDQLPLSGPARSDLCWIRWKATPGGARALCDHAIELDDTNHRAHYGVGWECWKAGEYEAAITPLTRAIGLMSDYELAYTFRGIAHLLLDNLEEAISDLTSALRLNPDPEYPTAYFYRGLAYARTGRFAEATADQTRDIELQRRPATLSYSNRGWTYINCGHYDEALADFTRAIQLAPEDPTDYAYGWTRSGVEGLARSGLALIHLIRGDDVATRAAFDALIALRAEDTFQAGLVAAWHARRGDTQQANRTANLALELFAEGPGDDLGQCLALIVLGRTDEAGQVAKKSIVSDQIVMEWINRVDLFDDLRRLVT